MPRDGDAPPPKQVTRPQRRAAVKVLNELSKRNKLERTPGYPWVLDRDARRIICKVLYRRLVLIDAGMASMKRRLTDVASSGGMWVKGD